MINFQRAREEALSKLTETNKVEIININVIASLRNNIYVEAWKVKVEIPVKGVIHDFEFLIGIRDDFPLSIPEIFLTEDDYNLIKFIPHVEDTRFICIFDEENLRINVNNPAAIIKACINKAKQIIVNGLNNDNNIEFKDEIVAYWENTYHRKDSVIPGIIGEGAIDMPLGENDGLLLKPPFGSSAIYVDTGSKHSKAGLEYVKTRVQTFKEFKIFNLGNLKSEISPPFYFNAKTFLIFLEENFSLHQNDILKFINRSFEQKWFIFSLEINNENFFFGFMIPQFSNDIPGFRKGKLSPITILSKLNPTFPLKRLRFKEFKPDRLQLRTDGVKGSNGLKVLVAGLGSIGSNLLFHLNHFQLSDVFLIDPDELIIENINRHLLTFDFVDRTKVKAMSQYLRSKNPFLDIVERESSIVNIIENEIELVNKMDFIFCAIGKDSVEAYILEKLAQNEIVNPVIFLWVEPYLLGGHILYVNPGTGFKIEDLEIDSYFVKNVIHSSEYENPEKQLLLREAGCQGSYVPYGKESIAFFLASFLPELRILLKEKPQNNLAFTFIGNLELAKSQNIELSEFSKSYSSYQLIKSTL